MSIDWDQVLAEAAEKEEKEMNSSSGGEGDLQRSLRRLASEMGVELLLAYLEGIPPSSPLSPNQALAMILSCLEYPKLIAFLQQVDEVDALTDMARMVKMGYEYGFLHGWKAAKAA